MAATHTHYCRCGDYRVCSKTCDPHNPDTHDAVAWTCPQCEWVRMTVETLRNIPIVPFTDSWSQEEIEQFSRRTHYVPYKKGEPL